MEALIICDTPTRQSTCKVWDSFVEIRSCQSGTPQYFHEYARCFCWQWTLIIDIWWSFWRLIQFTTVINEFGHVEGTSCSSLASWNAILRPRIRLTSAGSSSSKWRCISSQRSLCCDEGPGTTTSSTSRFNRSLCFGIQTLLWKASICFASKYVMTSLNLISQWCPASGWPYKDRHSRTHGRLICLNSPGTSSRLSSTQVGTFVPNRDWR